MFHRSTSFESSVNLDGTKTLHRNSSAFRLFESSVNLDGTKTRLVDGSTLSVFESSVNLDGTKTRSGSLTTAARLRVV